MRRANKWRQKVKKHYVNLFLRYFVLIFVGFIMVYPLIWMVGATFKSNAEIFSSIGFIPKNPTVEGYINAMQDYGGAINVWKAMLNTFSYVIPKVILTMISATVTAYGFGRFEFKGKAVLFAVLMSTLFLPQVVLNVPRFMWSSNDFMGPLLYVNTPAKYPLAIFVKMSMDADAGFSWNRILALSLLSIIPSLIVFFAAQDQFVEGISAGGVKG